MAARGATWSRTANTVIRTGTDSVPGPKALATVTCCGVPSDTSGGRLACGGGVLAAVGAGSDDSQPLTAASARAAAIHGRASRGGRPGR
jgi:hypothetical protein